MAADIVTASDDEGASGGAPRRVAEDGTGAGDGVFQGGYGGATGIIEVPSVDARKSTDEGGAGERQIRTPAAGGGG